MSCKISMVASAYNRPNLLGALIFSFLGQTETNWELIIVHDGPNDTIKNMVSGINDSRVHYTETPMRHNDFGHTPRLFGLSMARGKYIGLTNDDNYYVPVYLEKMIAPLEKDEADFVHCNMVHSYDDYGFFSTFPAPNQIDLGCWMAKRDLVFQTKWPDFEFDADGRFVAAMVNGGSKTVPQPIKVKKLDSILFVHN